MSVHQAAARQVCVQIRSMDSRVHVQLAFTVNCVTKVGCLHWIALSLLGSLTKQK